MKQEIVAQQLYDVWRKEDSPYWSELSFAEKTRWWDAAAVLLPILQRETKDAYFDGLVDALTQPYHLITSDRGSEPSWDVSKTKARFLTWEEERK